jgi:predicted AlkP superfamily phosphohydrolase/phosphomutase
MSEAKEARKVIVLGIDGGCPELVLKFARDGKLPNFQKLIDRGVFKQIIEPLPTITPPNWTTIGTGAWPGTHGITDFYLPHEPGDDLDKVQHAFNTRKCQAEYIWQAAERAGKKSVLVKWEVSWPPVHSGVQVEGCGPGVVNFFELGPVRLHTVEDLPMTNRLRLTPAKGWANLDPRWEALESELTIELHGGTVQTYQMLVIKSREAGYDSIIVCPAKNASEPVAQMKMGQWSEWVTDTFDMSPAVPKKVAQSGEKAKYKDEGLQEVQDQQFLATLAQRAREGLMPRGKVKGSFRFKLLNLSRDATELEIVSTQVWPVSGYTQPVELGEELFENVGPFFTNPARDALHYEWIDERTFYELMDYQHQWLARASKYLSQTREWDLLYVETHCGDYINHFYMQQFDKACGVSDAEIRNTTSWLSRHYQSMDRMLGELLSIADDDTLFVVVSDHSGSPSPWGYIDTRNVLEQAGLLVYKTDEQTGKRVVDWSRTKAYPQRTVYIYLNVKGRDPHGIVEPEDYDVTVDEVVEALRNYKHPKTGKNPYTLVLKKHEAEMIGLFGDRIGDVVYALRPEADLEHGAELPTSRVGDVSMRSLFVMAGPNVKEGVHLEGMAQLVSVAPTIAYLLGIPVPRNAEGAILYEALVDPDLRLNLQRKAERERDKWRAMYRGIAVEYDLNPRPEISAEKASAD